MAIVQVSSFKPINQRSGVLSIKQRIDYFLGTGISTCGEQVYYCTIYLVWHRVTGRSMGVQHVASFITFDGLLCAFSASFKSTVCFTHAAVRSGLFCIRQQ